MKLDSLASRLATRHLLKVQEDSLVGRGYLQDQSTYQDRARENQKDPVPSQPHVLQLAVRRHRSLDHQSDVETKLLLDLTHRLMSV